jgi:hypothetical protein
MTLVEVMIAAGLALAVILLLASFSRFQGIVWQNSSGDFSTQRQNQMAFLRIAPTIREARSVATDSSSATQLTLRMPAYDASGNLIIPLQDGQVISYYLSNATGNPANSGNILWRSVDGTPDTSWSLPGGKPRVVLSNNGLQLAYTPSGSPDTVRVSLTAAVTVGQDTSNFTTTQEVLLRNKGL